MKSKFFTLVETLLVISITSLLIPLIIGVIITIGREQQKIYKLSLIKKEGDNILKNIAFLIENKAVSIYSEDPPDPNNQICNDVQRYQSQNKMVFVDTEGNWFKIEFQNEKISSYSSFLDQSYFLNSDKTLISNFLIECNKNNSYSSSYIVLSFDICYKSSTGNCLSSSPDEINNLHYQTLIKLRNY